ncbi:MAG: glycosyltransferase family 2 protein [Lachnospiraceae bacterium]|nr:glycosyltransferase family 2 protein [Lachnospiraceae bacterium]
MENITVSVIIPVYNGEKYIEKCLKSVLEQTLPNIEIICIDDGSTDSTLDILKSFKCISKNIIIERQKNSGSGIARNLGIDIARGKYVHFMDADDYFAHINSLKSLYDAGIKNDAKIVGGNIQYCKNNKIVENYNNTVNFENEGFINFFDFQQGYYHQRYIFDLGLLRNNKIKYPPYRRFQDPPFLVKAMVTEGKFYAIKKDIYIYRVDGGIKVYKEETMADILCGLKDILSLSREYGLDILSQNIINSLLSSYEFKASLLVCIYKQNTVILQLINDINSYRKNGDIISTDKAEIEINRAKQYLYYLKKEIKNKQLIIYGSGVVGKRLEDVLKKNCKGNFIGYAVTNKKDGKQLEYYFPLNQEKIIIIGVREETQENILYYINNKYNIKSEVVSVDSKAIDFIYYCNLFHVPL